MLASLAATAAAIAGCPIFPASNPWNTRTAQPCWETASSTNCLRTWVRQASGAWAGWVSNGTTPWQTGAFP